MLPISQIPDRTTAGRFLKMSLRQFQNFIEELKINPPPSVLALYGSDRFLREKIINLLEKTFPSPKVEKEIFYASETSPNEVLALLQTGSIFSSQRMALVYQFQAWNPNQREEILKYAENPNPEVLLVLMIDSAGESERTKKIPEWLVKLSKKIPVVELRLKEENELKQLIKSQLKAWDKKIHPQALDLLLELAGTEPEQIFKELEKISLFLGKGRLITAELVSQLIAGSRLENVFELGEALGKRDLNRSLELFRKLISENQSLPMLLGLLRRHFRILFELNSCLGSQELLEEVLRKYRLYYFKKQYLNQAERFKEKELKKAFEYLYQAELKLKSSPSQDQAIFEWLITRLARL